MRPVVELDEQESTGLLPEEALRKIQDLLYVPEKDSPNREEQLELYGKMMFHAITLAEAKLISVNKRNRNIETMFEMWKPHVKALRRKP